MEQMEEGRAKVSAMDKRDRGAMIEKDMQTNIKSDLQPKATMIQDGKRGFHWFTICTGLSK